MPKMIQIRNVPDELHKRLKIRAAELGMTLSDYLLKEAERAVEKPTLQEMLERLGKLPPVHLEDPAKIIRQHRDGDRTDGVSE